MLTPAMAKNGSNQSPASGTGIVGSLTVVSNTAVPLAGTYVEFVTGEAHATVLQSTSAFTPSEADNVVFAPSNKKLFGKRWSALQIQNAETSAEVDVTVTYKGAAGTACAGGTYTDTGMIYQQDNLTPSSPPTSSVCRTAAFQPQRSPQSEGMSWLYW